MSTPPRDTDKKEEASNPLPDSTNSGVIRFEVDNISSLNENGRFSTENEVEGMPWVLKASKTLDSDDEDSLILTLFCLHHQLTPWSVDVHIEHTIVNSDITKNATIKYKKCSIGDDDSSHSFYVMSWSDLKEGFIRDDTITIEFRFRISFMWQVRFYSRTDFLDINDPCHDIALIIQGEKVYASKAILAVNSPVFKAMFYGNFDEKYKKEIELHGVDRMEFLDLLDMIHPSCKKVLTDNTVEHLLELGDRFQIEAVMELAERHFFDSGTLSGAEKLRIAEKYQSGKLITPMSPEKKKKKKPTEKVEPGTLPDGSNSGVIRFEVENVTTLDEKGRFSSHVVVGGVPWMVNVRKIRRSDGFRASMHLFCLHQQLTSWFIKAKIEHTIINADSTKNDTDSGQCMPDRSECFHEFCTMPWDDLIGLKKGYLRNDKMTIEIRLRITSMHDVRFYSRTDFSDPTEPSHDVALLIEEQKIYVSKYILAVHSPVFKAMFFGNVDEKNKKEFELKDVKREEFLDMLEMIYPSSLRVLSDRSVEYLLKLGDQFQIECVMEQAEWHLKNSDTITRMEKLRIADKYRSGALVHHYASEFWLADQFKEIQECSFYADLSAVTMRALYERMVGVMNYKYEPFDLDDL